MGLACGTTICHARLLPVGCMSSSHAPLQVAVQQAMMHGVCATCITSMHSVSLCLRCPLSDCHSTHTPRLSVLPQNWGESNMVYTMSSAASVNSKSSLLIQVVAAVPVQWAGGRHGQQAPGH